MSLIFGLKIKPQLSSYQQTQYEYSSGLDHHEGLFVEADLHTSKIINREFQNFSILVCLG